MARDAKPSSLYLRLPARNALPASALQASLPFAWSVRGRLLRIANATLP